MKLTNDNYYSTQANKEYMSVSQFKDFLKCEDYAIHKIKGLTEEEQTAALLVGSYVDAAWEGTLPDFRFHHPEVYNSRTGELKADFKKAEAIYQRTREDELFCSFMSGAKQAILEAEIFGYKWKCKIDSLRPDMIVDLKVMRDFKPVYVEGDGKVNFIQAWGYDIQGAIYQEIVRRNSGEKLPFYIAAATKEPVTDIGIFEIPQYKLDTALKVVEYNIDRFIEIKEGLTEPRRCETCDWCKTTKKLKEPIKWEEEY